MFDSKISIGLLGLSSKNNEETKCPLTKIKIMKDLNDDDMLFLSSSEEVLQVNKRGKCFYNTMRDTVERTYKRTFHL